MRVLNSLSDPRVGGPQLRALAVANELQNHDVETIFLLPNGSDAFENMATSNGFEVVRPDLPKLMPPSDIIGNGQFLLHCYPAVRRIRSVIQELDIDVVHAGMTLNLRAAVAAKRSSVPIAWFFNDTSTPWPINRITARLAQSVADEIAVAADAVHGHFFSDSVSSRTIYPPVNPAEFDPATITPKKPTIREEFGIPDTVPIVGTVGNINPIKGHKHLLHAITRVENQYGSIAVPIVGKVPESRLKYFEELKRLRSQLGLDDTVRFVGYRSDIPRLLSSFDIFVLPSVKEACPIAVLEAMAMENAVISTEVGGTSEQIVDGEHGWLVPPRDPAALANAICDALADPTERDRRGSAARERASNVFSIERCAERHLAMYNAALRTS